MDPITKLVYNEKEMNIKFVTAEETYVKMSDILDAMPIYPFLLKCIDKTHVLTDEHGVQWLDNDIFAGILVAFHPAMQDEMLQQTTDKAFVDMEKEAVASGADPDEAKAQLEQLKEFLFSDLYDEEQ